MKVSVRTGGIILAVAAVGVAAVFYADTRDYSVTPVASTIGTTSLLAATKATIATSTATSTLSEVATSTPKKIPTPVGSAPLAQKATVPVTGSQDDLTAAGGKLLHSLVNIVCLSSDPKIPSVSGTGVIIDSRGIILTASHVAQLFLLQDYLGTNTVSCLIRTGSPARRAYLAEPIYVSKTWIANNPATLTMSNPKGTGENDVALLGITATATSTPLPSTFPSIPLATRDPQPDEMLAIGSYGAQYLDAASLNFSLYPIISFGSVEGRYTYGNGTVDVVTVNGGAASQEGSSGGGLATSDGTLIGTITTSTITGDFSTRILNSVTAGHLRRSFTEDTGLNLDTTLADESVSTLISNFKNESGILGSQLAATIAAAK